MAGAAGVKDTWSLGHRSEDRAEAQPSQLRPLLRASWEASAADCHWAGVATPARMGSSSLLDFATSVADRPQESIPSRIPECQACAFNCLLNSSTQISSGHHRVNMPQTDPQTPPSTLTGPQFSLSGSMSELSFQALRPKSSELKPKSSPGKPCL